MAVQQGPSSVAKRQGLSARTRFLWIALLFVAVTVAYSNSFGNGFHFDDSHTVVDNPAIRSLSNIPRFFTDTSTFSVYPTNRTYRPLVSTTLAIDYALGHGLKPFWFHFGTFVFFLLLILLTGRFFEAAMDHTQPSCNHFLPALLGAAWFGLHPAMAETVNYVIQRGDLYCTLGCLAALVIWTRLPRLRRFGLYLLPFAAALLSKPPSAVFPVLLLFWTYFFERPAPTETEAARWKRSTLAIIPSVVVTIALLRLQSAMTPKTFQPSELDPNLYRLTQPFVWARYLGSLFLPIHLNVDSDLHVVAGFDSTVLLGLLVTAVLIAIIVLTWRRRQWWPVTFGLLWFFITQLPTSLYPLSEVENDHRMFFSFPGLMLAVVWCGWLLWQRFALTSLVRNASLAVLFLLLAAYGYGAHLRNAVWHDEASLWRDDVAKSPHNGRGLMTYGLTKMSAGNYPEALDLFTRALLYTPNYSVLEINLGVLNGAMAESGDKPRTAEAERHFQRAIALAPHDDSTYAFYGRWLLQQGRLDEARHALQQAIELNPSRGFQHDLLIETYIADGDEAAAHAAAVTTAAAFPGDQVAANELAHPVQQNDAFWLNRSLAQYRAGQYKDSLASAQQALLRNPHSAEAWNNIGAAYGAMQQWELAIAAEKQALTLKPSLEIAKNNLDAYTRQKNAAPASPTVASLIDQSLGFYRTNDFAASITAAKHAVALDPRSAEAWNNIAAGNAALHHWDAAIVAAQHAVALNPGMQLAKNNLAWAQSQKAAGAH
ncbi:MAG: tetratricopeptide repeat protein [Acidobacteriaceae bacterium]|nr:tetratricopeptide repeat protein [Acidobacteriaceae bacterium]